MTLPNYRFRYAALTVLENFCDSITITALKNAVNDPDSLFGLYAARMLARSGEPLLLEPVARCLAELKICA